MGKYYILSERYSREYTVTNTVTLVEKIKEMAGQATVKIVGVNGRGKESFLGDTYIVNPSFFEEISVAQYKAKFADAVLAEEIDNEEDVCIYDVSEMDDLLDHFGYDYHITGSNRYAANGKIADLCWKNKAQLRNLLRKHPNWDEEQQAVVFHSTIETGINSAAIGEFANFIVLHFRSKFINENKDEKFGELVRRKTDYEMALLALSKAKEVLENSTLFDSVQINYMSYEKLAQESIPLVNEYNEKAEDYYFLTCNGAKGYLTKEEKVRYENIINFFYSLEGNITSSNLDGEFTNTINELFPEVKAVVGQKTSRVINKICKLLGLDTIKDIQKTFNGEAKDYGYNYYFALLGDAINPLKISKYTVISINLFDYWTASRGTNWSSCHSIDIFHEDADWSNYDGCYSSGTESYMLDGSSVVMYTVDESYDGPMRKARKDRRMMAHISEDGKTFVFGRLYPDGRDGGEKGMAAQFRNILQKVLSECNGEPNYWTTVKGTESNRNVIDDNSRGTNYQDYFHYEDTGHSYVKGTEPVKIKIGHAPICPHCGYEHERNNNIFCHDCMRASGEENYEEDDYIGTCSCCGRDIYESDDDRIYCEDNDRYYCCDRCAERSDVHYCEDDSRYHLGDYCYRDDYDSYYYSGDPYIITDDGNYYHNKENAMNDGYHQNDSGEWTREEEEEEDVV